MRATQAGGAQQVIHEPKSDDLTHLVLEVPQQVGQPRGVVMEAQAADQRRPIGIRPLEDLEELPRRGLSEPGDDPLADVVHETRAHGVGRCSPALPR